MLLQKEKEELLVLWDTFINEIGDWFTRILDFHTKTNVRELFAEKSGEFVEAIIGMLGVHGLTVVLLTIEEIGRKENLPLEGSLKLMENI